MDNEEQLTIRAMLRNEVSGPLRQLRQELESAEKRINATNERLTSGYVAGEKAVRKHKSALDDLAKTATSPSFGQIGQQFSGMATMLDRATGSAGALATTLLTRVGTAGAVGFGALTAYGLKSAAAIEGMKVSFTTMFGDDGGTRLFSQLQNLANFTPFSTQQQLGGAQILGAYGIEENKLVDLSRAISDVASASSSPEMALHGIALALGQVQAKGKVAGQEIIQLANFQVPALQILASQYGKTTAEIQHMLDTGTQFSGTAFLDYFTQLNGPLAKFQGMSEKQSKTLAGVWSTFKSVFQQDAASAFAPASDQVKEFLPGFGKELSMVMQDIGPDLASITGELLQMAGPFVRILAAIAGPTLRFVADSLHELQPSVAKMATDSPGLAKSMGDFFDNLAPLVGPMGELIEQTPELIAAFGEMGGNAIPALLIPMLEFTNVILGLISHSPVLQAGLASLTVAVWALHGAFTMVRGVADVINALRGIGMAVEMLTLKYNGLAAAEARAGAAGGLTGGGGGMLGKLGKAAGVGGGLALGGFGLYEGAKADPNSAQSAIGLIGGTAALGATAGSVIPGLGTLLGGAAGGLAGGVAYGVKSFIGDTPTAWGNTLAMSNTADAMTPGSRAITSGVRNFGVSGPGSDHISGRAVDRAGSWMQSYAANVKSLGGYANVHDAGYGRHVHAAFGDVNSAPRSTANTGGGGGYDGPPIIITGNTISSNVDLERAVDDGIDRYNRRRKERT